MTRPAGSTSADRLHWVVQVGGRNHQIELLPALLGPVRIEMDGRSAGRVAKPTPREPWREIELLLDGEPVVVTLAWQFPVMRTDVFVRGRSVVDGRTLEDARRDASAAKTGYEAWFGLPGGSSWAGRGLFARPQLLVVLAALALWVVVGLLAPIPVGIPRAVAMAALMISAFAIGAVWFRSLFIVLDRVHQWSLARPELGDWRRVLAFYATLLGYAAASFAILFGILVTADGLT